MDIGLIVVSVITAIIGFVFGAWSAPKIKAKKDKSDKKGGENK